MVKAHDTQKGYSDGDGRLFGKERFSPIITFSPSPVSNFFPHFLRFTRGGNL